jgi:hypothetical protein
MTRREQAVAEKPPSKRQPSASPFPSQCAVNSCVFILRGHVLQRKYLPKVPQMSYPVDIKMPISDLEASPAEPLLAASEPERKRGRCWRRHHCGSEDGSGDELIVGKDARRKRCQKFRRRMICFKLFKFVFFAWLFFSLGKAFMVRALDSRVQ